MSTSDRLRLRRALRDIGVSADHAELRDAVEGDLSDWLEAGKGVFASTPSVDASKGPASAAAAGMSAGAAFNQPAAPTAKPPSAAAKAATPTAATPASPATPSSAPAGTPASPSPAGEKPASWASTMPWWGWAIIGVGGASIIGGVVAVAIPSRKRK